MSLKKLLRLRWEQLKLDEGGARVRWRAESEQLRLPDATWKVVVEYLQASGRLEGMQPGKYIFAPLAMPGREATGKMEEDWLETQPLSECSILASLKIYGRKLGIAEEKLTLMAMRRTAVKLRMEQGESIEGMKAFMDSREQSRFTKYRLGWLPNISGESAVELDSPDRQVEVPVRRAKPFKPGENTTHGLYSHKQDHDAVRAVLKEDIHGMEEETDCLRKLMRGLLEREGDAVRLVEAYSKATQRLGLLVTLDESKKQEKEDSRAEETLVMLDEIERRFGRPPVSQKIREHAYGISEDGLTVNGGVVEEIATSRLLLRNVYRRVLQNIDAAEYMRLVDLYGMGCVRLARLIKISGGDGGDRLERYLDDMLNEAIRQLTQEWGLDK